jgi:glycosyltransferase involved in cell wall biosynthesis
MPIWHKGVDLLIDALRLIETDRVNVSIHGDANVEPDYMRDLTSRAAGLPVHFKGSFGRHELQAVYASLDLVVVPSRWLENSPLVIHEAFRAGVPVAAARIGGIPELIQHGRNGLLFEPDSVDAVAAAINTVLDDPECLSRFRAAVPAVKRIEDDALEWEGRYEAVLGRDRTDEVSVL